MELCCERVLDALEEVKIRQLLLELGDDAFVVVEGRWVIPCLFHQREGLVITLVSLRCGGRGWSEGGGVDVHVVLGCCFAEMSISEK